MQHKEFHNWLSQNGLRELAKSNSEKFESILSQSLNIKDEEILIVSDYGYTDRHIAGLITGSYLFAAEKLGIKIKLVMQDPKSRGDIADKSVSESITSLDDKNIIILNLSNRLGTIQGVESFRSYAREAKHRFISTPSLGLLDTKFYPYVINSIDIDYTKLNFIGTSLMNKMDTAKEIHLTSNAGTDFYMNVKGKKAILNDGIYNIPGMGGNVPAGEVYTPPFGKKKIEGKVVIDASYSYRYGSALANTPITMTIENDEVTEINGGVEAKNIEKTLLWAESIAKYPWGIRRIGELGIGINPNARVLGATIIDEKTLGTAHVALGSNHWFGGTIYAITHFDMVMNNINFEIDGEMINLR